MSVDGRIARIGESIDPATALVTVSGRRVSRPAAAHPTLILNKPRGVVTTLEDERGRPCVADLLPKSPRYFPVGRLDADSTGVLLCTTDGELARVLAHPSFGVEKIYRVRATGSLTEQTKSALGARGVTTRADGTHTFTMSLREGRNRQVRRMCAQRGLRVIDLERIRFGPVSLGELREGATRPPTAAERAELERLRKLGQPDENPLKSRKRATVQPTE